MKSVTIRELHARTGELVRAASRLGEIHVTDNGRVITKILPQTKLAEVPYLARRKPSAAFKRLDDSGKTGRGADTTLGISEERDDRA
jgi:antitoxin (DNA-binding transcriptional repressor) of toxin-antitoxin stability system